ncbi:MAG TPA: hypothetical protein VG345_16485 [Bryobacteraceae bacterium]|jgi:hypothetical protein|nr:hypothetical protein [Bryobacteraceae bacterium]
MSTFPKPHELLRDLGRPISFYPELAKRVGLPLSIFICQLLYWTPRAGEAESEDGEGWIYKTSEEVERETSLTYEQQLLARKKAIGLGLLEEKYKRFEHRQYFRLKLEAFDALFDVVLAPRESQCAPVVLGPRESQCASVVLGPRESPGRDLGKAQEAPRESPSRLKEAVITHRLRQRLPAARSRGGIPRSAQIALPRHPAATTAAVFPPPSAPPQPTAPQPPAAKPAAAILTPADYEKEQSDRRKIEARDRRLGREALVSAEVRIGTGPEVAMSFVDCDGCNRRVTSIARSLCVQGKCPHRRQVAPVVFRPRSAPPAPGVAGVTASEREEFLANLRRVAASVRL